MFVLSSPAELYLPKKIDIPAAFTIPTMFVQLLIMSLKCQKMLSGDLAVNNTQEKINN